MKGEISCRDQSSVCIPGCKPVYFCCKIGLFNIEVYVDRLTSGDSLKWTLQELRFVAFLHWLDF